MKPSVDSAGGHHLLKHTAPSIERVVECFDGAPVKEISKLIMRMGQRELQAKFNAVYGTVTRSNNNDWLRRKLFESIGVKSSNKSKSAAKRDNKVGPAKANRVLKVTKPTTSRSSWSSPGDSAAPYSLAPPESPATVTHGDGSQAHTPFGSQVSPLMTAQPMSAASADSGYMSGASTMHARPYPLQRLASAPTPAVPGPHPSGPMGCGPVRIIYAPSHMPMHASMPAPIVRMPSGSGGVAPPVPHSFPATYFVHHAGPVAPPTPPLYNPSTHHSGTLSSMMSTDTPLPFLAASYPTGSIPAAPQNAGPVPSGATSPGPVWLPDGAQPLPPPAAAPPRETQRAEDTLAHSSDEEFTLTFLHPRSGSEAAAAPGGAKATACGAPAPALERNPWEPAARDARDVLVSNPVFDSAPLEALGCSMAAADCEMFGVAMEEGAGSGGDIAASSCDEGGYWAAAESSECAGAAVAPLESAGSALLDSALGSLVEASHSEGFGDRVMQVTRTMTRVGCCLVQWHHKLESAT